jgi:hypothetical protein
LPSILPSARASRASLALSLGSSEVLGPRLQRILATFRQHRGAAVIELVPAPTPVKLAAVAAGHLDAAFVRAAPPAAGVTVHPLWDEPFHAAIPARLAPADGGPVDLATLAGLPLSQASPAANPGVHELITDACRAAGFIPRPGPPLGVIQDLLAAHVAAGRCWTLLYASTPAATIPPDVVLLPTRPTLRVTTGLAVPHPVRRSLTSDLLTAARSTVTALPESDSTVTSAQGSSQCADGRTDAHGPSHQGLTHGASSDPA